MGGYGSGRSGGRTTVEDTLQLSAYFMQRERLLGPGRRGTISWKWGDEVTSSANYAVDEKGELLTLRYTRTRDGETEDLRTEIPLEQAPANYGGYRYYFFCPNCHRRYSKLYLPPGGKLFACRKCYRLTYQSCNESHKFDRLLRSIGGRIGLSPTQVNRTLKDLR